MSDKNNKKEYSAWFCFIALTFAIIFWASAYIAIRVAVREFEAGPLGLLRYGAAALVMLGIYIFIPNKTKLNLKDLVLIFITGAIGIGFYNVLINQGEVSVPAGAASFIIASMPVFSVLAACFFLKEKISALGVFGILISFFGIFLISFSEEQGAKVAHESLGSGIFFLLAAVFCAVFYGLMQKKLLKKFKAIELVCLSIFSAALIQIVFLPSLISELSRASFLSISLGIYLGIFPAALAYLGYTIALTRFSMVKANTSLFIMPFLALLMGWVILGERLSLLGIMGGILALLGPVLIHCVRLRKSKK